MHRHGYSGRKFGRERDQRTALLRGLSVALIEHGSIETTLPKAKELRPSFEKLVSKARKGDLHNRRQLVSSLGNVKAAHKLVDQIAPAMQRTSGYLRIERTSLRRGDNTQLAQISFVDSVKDTTEAKISKPAAKTQAKTDATSTKLTVKAPVATTTKAAPTRSATTRRTGVRGNK